MTLTQSIQLSDCDPEDINDIIKTLESSFGVQLDQYDLAEVKTFGDFCDVFENIIRQENREDCTSQQAFYKLRAAISESQGIEKETIRPDSRLTDLFPRKNRRKRIRLLEKQLDIKFHMLTCPGWVTVILIIIFIASLIALFFDWKTGLSGLGISYLAMWIADKTGKELELQTLRELTEKTAALEYTKMRRIPGTVNRHEIVATIMLVFSKQLGMDKADLTRETKFSCA